MISSFSIAQDWFPGRWGPASSRGYCVAIILPLIFLTQLNHQWIWLWGGEHAKLRSFLHVPMEEQRRLPLLPPRMGQCHIASPCCMRCQVTTWLTTGCNLVQLTQAVFQRAKFCIETSRQHHERQNEFPFNEGCCVETAWLMYNISIIWTNCLSKMSNFVISVWRYKPWILHTFQLRVLVPYKKKRQVPSLNSYELKTKLHNY